MKKLFIGMLAVLLSIAAFATTPSPVSTLNTAGSTAGQAIISPGPSGPAGWGNVSISTLTGILPIANGGTGQITAAAALTALGGLSTTTAASTYATITNLALKAPLASPTFTGTLTAANITASGTLTGFTGRLLAIQVFTANGTYTPTSGTTKTLIRVVGAGGGAGGTSTTASTTTSISAAGSAGSYAEVYWTSASSQTVTVGAAGTAGAAAGTGGTGGLSSVGAIVSCPGGIGGVTGAATTPPYSTGPAASPAACTVTGPTTILSVQGARGDFGYALSITSTNVGKGGSSVITPGTYVPAAGYGAGSGSAGLGISSTGGVGTAGSPGLVVFYDYQ